MTVPPYDKAAEQSCLGAMILRPDCILDVVDVLKAEDFYAADHQAIFDAILSAFKRGAVDAISVSFELKRAGKLAEGTATIVGSAMADVPSSANFQTYADIVRELADRRSILQTCEAVKERAVDRTVDPVRVAESAVGELRVISSRASGRPQYLDPAGQISNVMDLAKGMAAGWRAVDSQKGLGTRFRAGELAVIGARTGHCKTTFLVGLIDAWAETFAKDGRVILFYSHEEPIARIYLRLLALRSWHEGVGRAWSTNEIAEMIAANGESPAAWPVLLRQAHEWTMDLRHTIAVAHNSALSAGEVASDVRRVASGNRIGAVLVDYLQRLPIPKEERRSARRDIEVSWTARTLREAAEFAKCPVICGAQINRQGVAEAAKIPEGPIDAENVQKAIRSRRPRLHQLREGGSEQEAELVLGLLSYRADYVEEATPDEEPTVPDRTRLDVGCLKDRFGVPGRWVGLELIGSAGKIVDR